MPRPRSFLPDTTSRPSVLPLYPLLMRSIAGLFGGPVSLGTLSAYGVLISLVAFCFALYFVYRIAEETPLPHASRGIWRLLI